MVDLSVERITKTDLRRLARIAAEERDDFFNRHPEWKLLYARRMLCTVLCGRSALHFCNGSAGVDEFHVWSFYAIHSEAAFPYRLYSYRDFGNAKFGSASANDLYVGRRVRLTGRSIPFQLGAEPVAALQAYFRSGRTHSARQLRRSSVVIVEPESHLGFVVWPTLLS